MTYEDKQQLGQMLSGLAPALSLIPGGGVIAGGAAGIAGGLLMQSKPPSTKLAGSAYGYGGKMKKANGGTLALGNSSFEVNGNPNKKDSVYYPQKNVFLDDKEVVKNDFVFSNRIMNPLTGKSFAQTVRPTEAKTAKAEEHLRRSGGADIISQNTIKHNNSQVEGHAQLQEAIAHIAGLRNPSPKMAGGGPIGPSTPGTSTLQYQVTDNGRPPVAVGPEYGNVLDEMLAASHPYWSGATEQLRHRGEHEVPALYTNHESMPFRTYSRSRGQSDDPVFFKDPNTGETRQVDQRKAYDVLNKYYKEDSKQGYLLRDGNNPKTAKAMANKGTVQNANDPEKYYPENMQRAGEYKFDSNKAQPVDGQDGHFTVPTTDGKTTLVVKRSSDGSYEVVKHERTKSHAYGGKMADGGPLDPQPWQKYMEIGKNQNLTYYYDPYNKRQLMRDPGGQYYESSTPYDLPNQAAIDNHLSQYNEGTYSNKVTTPYEMFGYPQPENRPVVTPYDLWGRPGQGGQVPSTGPTVVPTPGSQNAVSPSPTSRRVTSSSRTSTAPLNPVDMPTSLYPTEWSQVAESIPYFKQSDVPYAPNTGMNPVASSNTAAPSIANFVPQTASAAATTVTAPTTGARFTTGDYMQMVAAASRFADAARRPEVEAAQLDNTNITKQTYDPRVALGSNAANFQNSVNSINGSTNLRRALAKSMYANKLTADSDVLSKYQEMNNQARVQYEDRLSNKNRYNAQAQTYTNDMNARNRASSDYARQAAFDTFGNVGQALNSRKYSYDSLRAIKEMYPDVYARIMQDNLING